MASIDEVDEMENLSEKSNTLSTTVEIIPKTAESLENKCLIIWSPDDEGLLKELESLSQAEAFLSRKRVMVAKSSYSSKTGILFPLIALEQKIPYILESATASPSLEDNAVPHCNTKPYSFKRPKITVTFEELENYDSEDEENFAVDCEQQKSILRKQPERQSIPLLTEESFESTDEESLEHFISDAVDQAISDNHLVSNDSKSIHPSASREQEGKEMFSGDENEENIAVQSEETRFEEYVDHARTSAGIAHMDEWWERNRVFNVKKPEQTEDEEENQNFRCCICNMIFSNNESLESHIETCFEN